MKKLLLSLALAVSGIFGVSAETASIDFTTQNYADKTNLINQGAIAVGNDISLTFSKTENKNTNPQYYTNGAAVRFYAGNKLTIETVGYKITKVVITSGTTNVITSNNSSVSVGALTYSNNGATWEPLSTDTEVNSIEIKNPNTSGHFRIKKIEITYTSTGGGGDVVKVEPVEISYEVKGASADVTLSCATEGATIYYGTSEADITTVYSEPFTVTESCTIYAFAQKGEDKSSIKSAQIALPYTSFKEAVKAGNGESITVVGNFSVIYNAGRYLMLTDGISNLLAYDVPNAPAVGTAISKVSGTVELYGKLFELKNAELTAGGSGADITPTELTSLSGLDIVENIFDFVAINGCSISGTNGKNATLTLGSETIALYNNFGLDANTFANGENLKVKGFVWQYSDNLQICPTEIAKVTDPTKQDPNLTFAESEKTFDITETNEGVIQGQVVTAPEGLEVTYSSSNSEGLGVDTDGVLYVYQAGTYIITAATEGNDTYNAGSASYTVTVTNNYALGDITVNSVAVEANATINVKVGDKVTFAAENAASLSVTILGEKTKASVSEEVNGSSYEWSVTAADSYMVEVTAKGKDNSNKQLSLTIVATENAPVVNTKVTLDFVNNLYGMKRLSGSTSEYNPDPFTLQETESLSVVAAGANRLWKDGLRMYSGSFLSITAPDKYIISNCEYSTTGDSFFSTELDKSKKVWTISYTALSSQKAIKTITVTLGLDPERVSPTYETVSVEPNTIGGYTVKVSHNFEGVSVYYKHTPATGEQAPARRAVDHSGYTQADVNEDGVHTFNVAGPGVVEYYGYNSATDTKGSVHSFKINSDGTTTSIKEITAVKGVDAVYDLMGRKVTAPVRGLYIKNGVKHFVR